MERTDQTRLKIPPDLEAKFIEAFGPRAQSELESSLIEALERNQRLCNKNIGDVKKFLQSPHAYDTID